MRLITVEFACDDFSNNASFLKNTFSSVMAEFVSVTFIPVKLQQLQFYRHVVCSDSFFRSHQKLFFVFNDS